MNIEYVQQQTIANKKRLEEKVRASEEQKRALRKMLNDQNEKKAADQENPFEQGGRA